MANEAGSLPTPMGEDEWHEKTGQEPNVATKMAYAIITGSPYFAKSRKEVIEKFNTLCQLYKEFESADVEEMVRKWRLPGYNLNLVQLAVLLNNVVAVGTLKVFFPPHDEDNPENQCLLLDCVYNKGHLLMNKSMNYSTAALFKKGFVTVAPNPSHTPEAPAVWLDIPLRGSCLDFALQNKYMSFVLYLVPKYFEDLEETRIAPAIECLWLALDHIQQNQTFKETCLGYLVAPRGCNADISKNLFLLCCQLLNAPGGYVGSSSCLTGTNLALCMLSEAVTAKEREDLVSLLARHCTRTQLQLIISILEDDSKGKIYSNLKCPHVSFEGDTIFSEKECVLEAFGKELNGRTLQDEAMLTILRSVGGDARRAKTLSDLPKPLLELFPVPFQDLTGSTQ